MFWIIVSPFIALFLMIILFPVGVLLMVYLVVMAALWPLSWRWPKLYNRLWPPRLRY